MDGGIVARWPYCTWFDDNTTKNYDATGRLPNLGYIEQRDIHPYFYSKYLYLFGFTLESITLDI